MYQELESPTFASCARFGLAGFARFGKDVPGNALTGYELDTKAATAGWGLGVGQVSGTDQGWDLNPRENHRFNSLI